MTCICIAIQDDNIDSLDRSAGPSTKSPLSSPLIHRNVKRHRVNLLTSIVKLLVLKDASLFCDRKWQCVLSKLSGFLNLREITLQMKDRLYSCALILLRFISYSRFLSYIIVKFNGREMSVIFYGLREEKFIKLQANVYLKLNLNI